MEDFLSKYGWLIVVAAIIIIALGLANVSGNSISDGVSNLILRFTTSVGATPTAPTVPSVGG